MTRSGTLLILLTLAACAARPPAAGPAGQGGMAPAVVAVPSVGEPGPAMSSGRLVTGRLRLRGVPVAGAIVRALSPASAMAEVAAPARSDDDGRFALTLTTDTGLVLLEARKEALALFAVDSGGFRLAGTDGAPMGLGTTVVGKCLLPKLVEVVLSQPPDRAASTAELLRRLHQLETRFEGLAGDADIPPHAVRILDAAGPWPGPGAVEDLTDVLVAGGGLQGNCLSLIDDANQAILDNLLAGGNPVQPGVIWAGGRMVNPPSVRVVGERRLLLQPGGGVARHLDTAMPVAPELARTAALVAACHTRLGNRVRWGGQGVGGGGSGGAAPPPADTTGDLTIQDGAVWTGPPAGSL